MNRVGAEGEIHKSYHVTTLCSFYTHIHKNLTFKTCISCCLVNSLHSAVPGIGPPVLPEVCICDVVATASYSNHNKVTSVKHRHHTNLHNSYHVYIVMTSSKKFLNGIKGIFLQGSQPKNVLKLCMLLQKFNIFCGS